MTISIGPAPLFGTSTVTPFNVTRNVSQGGLIFYGTKGITANATGGNNTLTATGRTILFSTGAAPASAITLGGNVSINAIDPVGYTTITQSSDDDVVVDSGDDDVDTTVAVSHR